jgi:hypothetical protein
MPAIIITTQRNGKKFVVVQNGGINGTTIQLQRIIRGHLRSVVVIDQDGNCYSHVKCRVEKIALEIYFHRDYITGLLALLLDIVFFSVMMRVNFVCEEPHSVLSLSELKNMVCEAIRTNPSIYTRTSSDQIINRVKSSKDIPSLLFSFSDGRKSKESKGPGSN